MVKPLRADWSHLRLAVCLTFFFCFLFSVLSQNRRLDGITRKGRPAPSKLWPSAFAFCCLISVFTLLSGRDVGQDL